MSNAIYINGTRYIPLSKVEVEAELNVSRLCESGAISCKKVGAQWYVDVSSLENVLRDPQQTQKTKEKSQENAEKTHAKTPRVVRFVDSASELKHKHQAASHDAHRAMLPLPRALAGAVLAIVFIVVGYGLIDAGLSSERFARDGEVYNRDAGEHVAAVSGALVRDIIDTAALYIHRLVSGLDDEEYVIGEGIVVKDVSGLRQLPLEEPEEQGEAEMPAPAPETSQEAQAASAVAAPVIQQQVIERIIERERIVEASDSVKEGQLTQRLEELNNKLTARITDLTAVNSQEIVNNYKVISQTNKIDNLEDVTIKNSTVTGGSVTATGFDGTLGISSGGTGVSTAPSYGQLLLGQSDGSYALAATSTLGITSGITGTEGYSITFDANGDQVATSTLVLTSNERVGVGTTSPWRKFSITDTVSNAQVAIAYDVARYTQFQTDSVGDLIIDPQGGDVFLNDDNLWVCTGGSCPSGNPAGTGNLVVESNIGVGTTTPNYALAISGDASTNFFQIASSTDQSIFTINNDGHVGIGTSTPTEQLSVRDRLFVGAGGISGLGLATSTFQGDIRITGKLDVGTIDPVYSIDGTKYATYGHSTVGVKEEVTFTVVLEQYDEELGAYVHKIDLNDLRRGSDLWLFHQITDYGKSWRDMVVVLTPSFGGRVYYRKDIAENVLHIAAEQKGEVSIRIVAPRFDAAEWPNLRSDQDDGFSNFELEGK